MINFKREYIGLEQDRLLYPVSFKDKAKCNVYGRKKFITEAGEVQLSAHVFLISKDFWTFNAGQLDFTNYPNGIWNDYISIDIIEKDEYTAPSINFGSMGDITPENLQGLSDYISKHLSDLEKRIVEDYLFIDEGVSENIELPNLPENHFWVRKNGVIVGVNLDYLKTDYEHFKNELWKNYESFNEKLQAALKKYYDDLELQMNNFFKDLIEKIREEAEKQLGLIAGAGGGLLHKIDQANHGFIFDPIVYENGVWKKATTTSGVDGIGVVISANTFFFLEAGEIEIPKGATDKDGQPLLDDEYYYMNEDGGTGFQKEEPVWFYQPLFHTRTHKGKLLANVHIDTMEDLRGQVVDTESGRTHGIALWGDIVPKFDTIEKLQKAFWLKEGEVVEVLGYYSAGDGAGHKRIIANEDDGSGVQLSNNLWACIVHNGEVNVSWFGAKGNGTDDDGIYFQKAFSNNSVITVFYDKDYWIKSNVDTLGKNKILKGTGLKRQMDNESGKTLYIDGGKFITLFKIIGVNAIGTNKKTDVFCEMSSCFMRYVENCDFRNFLNVFNIKEFMGMFCMRNVSFIAVENACINFDFETKTKMCTVSNFENISVYTTNHFISGEYAELVTFTFKNIIFEEVYGTPIIASIVTQCSFENIWLEKGDSESNKYMITTRVPQLIYATTFNNIRRHNKWELYNPNTGGGVTFPRKEDEEQLFLFKNNNGGATEICGGIVGKNPTATSGENKLILRSRKRSGYGNGSVEVSVQGGQFLINGNDTPITRQDIIKIFKSDYDINFESKEQTIVYTINDKIFSVPQVIVFDKNNKISSTENGLATITEKSAGVLELVFGESLRCPAITVTVNSNEDFYVHKMYFVPSYSGAWQTYGDAKSIEITFSTLSGVLKTPERVTIQIHNWLRGYKKKTLQLLQENVSEKLLQDENVYDDYISYMDEKTAYDKQQRKLEEQRQLAYEEALKENPNLTYEEFMSVQPMTLNFVEEPQPSQALKQFMEKYL